MTAKRPLRKMTRALLILPKKRCFVSNAVKKSYMIKFENIQQLVCIGEGIDPNTLQTTTRKREVVFARQLVMYFLRKHTNNTLLLASSYYNKDHATCLHSVKVINNLIDTDKSIRNKVTAYEYKFKALIDFEENIITDKIIEMRESLKIKIDNALPISLESIIIYNKLLERTNEEPLI